MTDMPTFPLLGSIRLQAAWPTIFRCTLLMWMTQLSDGPNAMA